MHMCRRCNASWALVIFLLFLCSSFTLLGSYEVFASELPELTLSEVLRITKEANPTIVAASRKIDQAAARVLQAVSAKSPTLDVSLVYQETEEEPNYPVYDGSTGSSTPYYAKGGFKRSWKAAMSMSYLLYSGGSVENNIKAQELAKKVAEAEYKRTVQHIENDAARAYYNLLKANDHYMVAKEALKLSQEHFRQVEAFYKHGVVPKNEVLRVQVAVSQAELDLIQAQSALDIAWLVLERVAGTEMKGKYRLISTKNESPLEDKFSVPKDPVSMAFKMRPEIKALESARQSALRLAKAAMGKKRPQILLSGEAYKADEDFPPDAMDDWRVSVAAVWTLYDGQKAEAEAKEAVAKAEEVLYSLEDLKRGISLEVNTAIKKLEAAVKRIDVAKNQVAKAEEDYRMALRRYSAQVGTNIDVLDARVALINAKNNFSDAVYEAKIAEADLQFALGATEVEKKDS